MAEAVLEVDKKYLDVKKIKRLELEYKDMNYIIVNLLEKVIDVNGELYEFTYKDNDYDEIIKMVWEYENLDEFDYWPDKTRDHEPLSPMWRIAWYDENDTYYHKSGATKYPDDFMKLIDKLKKLNRL